MIFTAFYFLDDDFAFLLIMPSISLRCELLSLISFSVKSFSLASISRHERSNSWNKVGGFHHRCTIVGNQGGGVFGVLPRVLLAVYLGLSENPLFRVLLYCIFVTKFFVEQTHRRNERLDKQSKTDLGQNVE